MRRSTTIARSPAGGVSASPSALAYASYASSAGKPLSRTIRTPSRSSADGVATGPPARSASSAVSGSCSVASIAAAASRSAPGSRSTIGSAAISASSQRASASLVSAGCRKRTAFQTLHSATSASSRDGGAAPAALGVEANANTAAANRATRRIRAPCARPRPIPRRFVRSVSVQTAASSRTAAALKYAARGWWITIAAVDCSGMIWCALVSETPIAFSASSSFQTSSCCARSGHAP